MDHRNLSTLAMNLQVQYITNSISLTTVRIEPM